jgi:aldose 1-epimerase
VSANGFQTVSITSARGAVRAEFVPAANMLCRSLTHRNGELLDPGHGVAAYAERGKTMGIPLLHPWANRLAGPGYEAAGKRVQLPAPEGRYPLDPNGLPIHGALPGLLRWTVLAGGDGGDTVSAQLAWDSPELLALFPFVHELRLDARVSEDALEVATTLLATGEDAVPASFGYHPYLVPGGERAEWQLTLGASRRLVLDERMIPTGDTEALSERSFRLADQSWDDGLADLATPPSFTVSSTARTLSMTFVEGYDFAQVFAPPGKEFICFEPMTAPTNALASGDGLTLVSPGGAHRAAFSVSMTDN